MWSLNATYPLVIQNRSLVWELASKVVDEPATCNEFVVDEIFIGDESGKPPAQINNITAIRNRPGPPYAILATDVASRFPSKTDTVHQCAALICYARCVIL